MASNLHEAVFLIAEAGVNHNGSVELAHQLVDVAADLHASAIKFQTFDAALVSAAATATAGYQRDQTGHTDQKEMLEGLSLPKSAWQELADHSADRSIEFMSTAFDEPSLEILTGLGVRRLKIPSGELTNLRFIERVASAGLPTVISTGMGTMDEVVAAAGAADTAPSVEILHCVSAYPAPVEEANLLAIPAIRDQTGLRVGWSDHCRGTLSAQLALALGARTFERHLTLDHEMEGPDHRASDDPEEFEAYAHALASALSALGTGVKRPTESELGVRDLVRRSWHLRRDVEVGRMLTVDDVIALRPASGITVALDVIGREAAVSASAGDVLTDDMLR